MTRKTGLFSAAVLALLAVGPGFGAVTAARAATECVAADKIDGSTAATATKTMERAGFLHVKELKKGCDNFWHGVAIKDGSETHVGLTPQGEVRSEGN
jgi:hypothetical protein